MPDTRTVENYLKVIYNASEWSDRPVTISVLAKRLGLAASTVSEVVTRLTEDGLVSHEPYAAVELTEAGRHQALSMVRKHRLIETFLVDYLGYGWDEVHDEAEVLEHAVSDAFIERLAGRLGDPRHDPHGDPIPSAEGVLADEALEALDGVEPGATRRLARVSDDDVTVLRDLRNAGIDIGDEIRIVSNDPATTVVVVEAEGTSLTLPRAAARTIRVSVDDPLE